MKETLTIKNQATETLIKNICGKNVLLKKYMLKCLTAKNIRP